MNNKLILGTLLVALTSLGNTTFASTALISFTGSDPLIAVTAGTFGWSFSTNSNNLDLTHLGLYDADGDGFSEDHEVTLYDSGGSFVASVTLTTTAPGTLDSATSFRYATLSAPAQLLANSTYHIGAFKSKNSDSFIQKADNVITDPEVNYMNGVYSANPNSIQFPTTLPPPEFQQGFFGPNFKYDIVQASAPSVPAPDALILIFSGLSFVGIRKKSTKLKV